MQGAAAFFLASSRNGAASCAGGVAGAGACWSQPRPLVSPVSAAKKDIPASVRKRVRLPTVHLEAYHFCRRDSRHALCLRMTQKSGALSRPALRCLCFVLAMLQVLAMASAATTSTVGITAVKASATASMEHSTAVLTTSAAPMHASFHSMSGAAVSETVPEIPAMVVRELTATVVTEVAAMAATEIAAMIEAATVIEVSIVMITATPVVEVMIKMFIVVAVKAERSKSHEEGRIEAPSERAIVDPI